MKWNYKVKKKQLKNIMLRSKSRFVLEIEQSTQQHIAPLCQCTHRVDKCCSRVSYQGFSVLHWVLWKRQTHRPDLLTPQKKTVTF